MSHCMISTSQQEWTVSSVSHAWERAVSRKDTMSVCRNLFLFTAIGGAKHIIENLKNNTRLLIISTISM